MRRRRGHAGHFVACCLILLATASASFGQSAPEQPLAGPEAVAAQHERMNMSANAGWQFMQDGILFAEFNHQGGPRGGDEFVAPNWWMGMASREHGARQFTFTSMFSLDPATVGQDGYREIFQAGEALDGRPLIDRQHPHDFFMQLAAVWRVPIGPVDAGSRSPAAPVGEPALGPVAFMHRASAADNPTAPLEPSHVRLDARLVRRRHGGRRSRPVDGRRFALQRTRARREPLGFRLRPARFVFRPGLVSAQCRVGASGVDRPPDGPRAAGARKHRTHDCLCLVDAAERLDFSSRDRRLRPKRHGSRAPGTPSSSKGTRHVGSNTFYGRFEGLQVETALLLTGMVVDGPPRRPRIPCLRSRRAAFVTCLRSGFRGGIGADVTFYGVPASLQPAYGGHPVSFHVFFRLRLPAGRWGGCGTCACRSRWPAIGCRSPR